MKYRRVLMAVALLALIGIAYLAGYSRGQLTAERNAARFSIAYSLGIYLSAKAGDTKAIESASGTILYGGTKWYEKHFAGEKESEGFQWRLDEARKIAAKVETKIVVLDPEKIIEDFNRENAKPKPGVR